MLAQVIAAILTLAISGLLFAVFGKYWGAALLLALALAIQVNYRLRHGHWQRS